MTLSHMGQAQDVLVHKLARKEDLPLVEEYEALTLAKTSSLLRMMGKMLCVLFNRSQQEMNILS
jgi:geranylgeranyl pyrophosphate synthase